jgi:hypothetical protein
VAGGLAISTFFTLWVVPLAYTLFDDLAAALRTYSGWAFKAMTRRATRADQPPPGPDRVTAG